jgi:type I restriction enzyme, S subunit
MSELPKGWTQTSLGVIAGSGQYGWTTKASDKGSVKFLRTTDITRGEIDWERVPYCDEPPEDVEKYRLRKNDIVISRAGSVGFSKLIEDTSAEAVFASYLIRFSPVEGVEPRYLAHFLRSEQYWQQVRDVSAGVALANVNAKKLSAIRVPLAPLTEQKRIADKLDRLLAAVDTCKARLDAIPVILQRFRQSVLAAATSGELTEEWRRANQPDQRYFAGLDSALAELPPKMRDQLNLTGDASTTERAVYGDIEALGWRYYSLQQLVDQSKGIPYGIVQTGASQERGVPTVRAGDIKNFSIDVSQLKLVSPELSAQYRRTVLTGGEILLAIRGSVGSAAIAPPELAGGNISREVAMIPLVRDMERAYVVYVIASSSGQKLIGAHIRGVAQAGINLADLRQLAVPVPTLNEQKEIVRRIEGLFSAANALGVNVGAAHARVDRLTQSVLAKAFRGELVPQDPSEEPFAIPSAPKQPTELSASSPRSVIVSRGQQTMKKKVKQRSEVRSVIDVLRMKGEPISAQQLIAAAGYPSDAAPEEVERFLLDLRDNLLAKPPRLIRERIGDQDFFSLAL